MKFFSETQRQVVKLDTLDQALIFKESDLKVHPIPLKRALGVIWCVENDSFQFVIEIHDHPFTHRGILSTVGSQWLRSTSDIKGKTNSSANVSSLIGIAQFQKICFPTGTSGIMMS